MLTFENNSSVMISILGFRRIGVSHILLIPTCSSIPEFIHLCEIPNNGRLVKTNVLSDFRPSLDNNLDLAALLLPSHEYSASVRFSKRLVLVVMEIFAESGRWNFIKQMSASTEKCIYLSRSRNGVRANRIYEPKLFGQRNMQLLTSEVQSGATRFKQKCPNSSVSLSWDIVGTWPGTLVRQFVGQSQNVWNIENVHQCLASIQMKTLLITSKEIPPWIEPLPLLTHITWNISWNQNQPAHPNGIEQLQKTQTMSLAIIRGLKAEEYRALEGRIVNLKSVDVKPWSNCGTAVNVVKIIHVNYSNVVTFRRSSFGTYSPKIQPNHTRQ
ncbi:11168_t:CDS:2 [Funneliformis geosporum]|nr:11168_t:CDS:2 [Funneliformis geosporum]